MAEITNLQLATDLLEVLDRLSGLHPGFRPAHAKGTMASGAFVPSPGAARLTRAPHALRPSTPVVVRFSNGTGVPTIPDNDPAQSGPRGCAVRFQLGAHEHTDIVAHSADAFPVRTGEEFLEFLRAAAEAGAGRPEAIGRFLATHPNARRFVELPKPIPTSFAREAFFAITSFAFVNAEGTRTHGRFRFRPREGTAYLSAEAAATHSRDFLFDEIKARLARGPIVLEVSVQVAGPGDDPTDASTSWPADRKEVPFGTITLDTALDPQLREWRKVIFDPLPRVDGLESSGDPLTQVRADLYLLSGRRRRAVFGDGAR